MLEERASNQSDQCQSGTVLDLFGVITLRDISSTTTTSITNCVSTVFCVWGVSARVRNRLPRTLHRQKVY